MESMSDDREQFYSLKPVSADGGEFSFEQLRGKVVLIVNVASNCGFTTQYKDLEHLYRRHEKGGLVILGFPCNQFGHQEPGTNVEIKKFCVLNFGITFPILSKIDVNGADADPVYQFLKSKKSDAASLKGIKWNFEKFLINSKGDVVDRFSTLISPMQVESRIEELLAEI